MATKLYLHDAATTVAGTLPAASSISVGQTLTNTAAGASTNRSMDEKVGTSQKSIAITAGGASQTNWFRRFVSQPLAATTINPVGNLQFHDAVQMSNAAATHIGRATVAIWRPSTGALVGFLSDPLVSITASGTTETAGGSTVGTGPPPVVVQDGDVIVVEMWGSCSRNASTTYTQYYDGTTDDSTTSNAAYIAFTQTLTWYVGPTAILAFVGSAVRRTARSHAASLAITALQTLFRAVGLRAIFNSSDP